MNNFNYFLSLGTLYLQDNKAPTSVNFQEKFVTFNLDGQPFLPGDILRFYSTPNSDNPCFVSNRRGTEMKFYNLRADGSPHFPPQWFGTGVGVTGVTSTSNSENLLHLCYINFGEINDGYNPSRVQNYALTSTPYTLTLNSVSSTTYPNYLYPEI